jgi:catechol 2,3-dioxygenase-like lactoylglutathione lyase family enzyme
MLDHIGFAVADFKQSRAFYLSALAPLGIAVLAEGDDWAMLGANARGSLWIGTYGTPPGPLHFAFTAASRDDVRRFHAAALAAGGKDHGAPGIRGQYHPNYYAAFVIDPNGHNLEAVCHAAEE